MQGVPVSYLIDGTVFVSPALHDRMDLVDGNLVDVAEHGKGKGAWERLEESVESGRVEDQGAADRRNHEHAEVR